MSTVDRVIAAARAELGSPYVWGDEGPNTFDCSGLMQFIYAQVGVKLPRVAAAQQRATRKVSSPQPGDLVFYNTPATHVGLYIGSGKMIHAPGTGDRVRIANVYGTPAGYHRVAGIGAGLAPITDPVADVAGGVAGTIGGWLSGIRYGLVELAFVAAGAGLVALGLWRTVTASRRQV